MTKQTEKSVLVDTCFLISLVNAGDAQHPQAKEYFMHFMAEGIDLHLSIISLSELMQKQEPEILENFKILTFGLAEVEAQRRHFDRSDASGLPAQQKVSVKDDIKIVATCLAHNIKSVVGINDDFNRLALDRGISVIDYRVPLNQYLGRLPFAQ